MPICVHGAMLCDPLAEPNFSIPWKSQIGVLMCLCSDLQARFLWMWVTTEGWTSIRSPMLSIWLHCCQTASWLKASMSSRLGLCSRAARKMLAHRYKKYLKITHELQLIMFGLKNSPLGCNLWNVWCLGQFLNLHWLLAQGERQVKTGKGRMWPVSSRGRDSLAIHTLQKHTSNLQYKLVWPVWRLV